jgi:hypothetical protein
MMHRSFTTLASAFLFVFTAYNAFAWGGGHDSQSDQIWKNLPESFKSHFTEKQRQDFVKHYSHYTDYYAARKPAVRKEPAAECCARTVKEMKFNPHKTHIVFPLFVKAWREKKYEDALMWAGCMTHSIGDMGALNHPDIIWFSHVCLGWSGAMGPGGRHIASVFAPDSKYNYTYFNKDLQAFYDKAMDGCEGKVISSNPQEALEHIIVRDHFRKEEMNANPFVYEIFLQMEKYNKDNSPETLAKIANKLAQYTKSANQEILDTLVTGIAFAEMTEEPNFDRQTAEKEASKKIAAKISKDSIRASDMIVFTGIWQDKPLKGAVGVLVSDRPSLVYSGGCPLGSKHQWLTSIVLHGLKSEKIPYQCISFERLQELDPSQNPMLLVVAPKIIKGMDFKKLEDTLEAYMKSGGKLIWLGGSVPAKLATLLPENELPPSSKGNTYLFPFPIIDKDKRIKAEFIRISDGKKFPVADLSFDKITWNTFGECRSLFFKDFNNDETRTAFLKLKTPEIDRITGVQVKVGKGEFVYAPWFVFCPYMLSDNRQMESLVNLGLDSVGREILRTVLGVTAQADLSFKEKPDPL